MKFLYEDLISYLSVKPSKEIISEKLFQLGHEHEIEGDIFDMDFTPNRGDCLSLVGLSRDLGSFFGHVSPLDIYKDDIEELKLNFTNLSTADCPKITFLEIEIEGEISGYKPYLENYFSLFDNNKTNFFTDISNYVSYEQGQPTHCFDRSKIKKDLTFENRFCDEKFHTLLGSEIQLNGKNCVFISDEKIISLAGVMGGESTACSNETKRVLVECAYFNPEVIVGKSVKYNLNSDAAHKFERGVDIMSQNIVLRRFIRIVQDHASIKSIKIKTFSDEVFENTRLPLNTNNINKILGVQLNKEDYLNHFSNLGFPIENNIIEIPSYRHDITNENDLSEEIARILGYNNIKSKPLNLPPNTDKKNKKIVKIENFLVKNGFTEVINYPFSSVMEEKSITIDNPLDVNRKHLRTSLKSSLVDNLLFNERRQKDSIKLFEVSDVYTKDFKTCQKKLGIIVSGRVGKNHIDFSKKLDNNYLSQLLNNNLNFSAFEINKISRNNLKTKINNNIFFTEISIDDIPDDFFNDIDPSRDSLKFIKYLPASEFPSSMRDFSFSIQNPDKYEEVIECIANFNHQYLKESFIFDFYVNHKKEEIKVGVRLIFQSISRTLSENDIQKSLTKILKPVVNIDGVLIPGLELK